MKTLLLLILSLMTVCVATFQVKGCEDGWVEFTCKYPEANQNYKNIKVEGPRRKAQSSKKDEWEKKDGYSLYHDRKNKILRVVMKQLQQDDFGNYQCEFKQDSSEELDLGLYLVKEEDVCKEPFIQTAYETAKTNITCDYPDNYSTFVKFICKDNNESCEEILSTSSPLKSNGTFTLTNTNSGFNMSISNVNSQHAGVYWCGMKQGRNRTSVRKIHLEIKSSEATSQVNGCEDGWVEFNCEYPKANQNYKNIKVEGPTRKKQSTKKDEWEKKGRFSLYHDTKNKTLRVVIKQLQQDDFGEYQCKFKRGSSEELELKLDLINVKDVCKEPFIQTAYESAKTTITCDYPDKYKSKVKFICKDNNESCEEILSTPSSVKSNGTFTLTNTISGFNVSISNVSSQHAGDYWCGMKQGRNRTSVRKIQLKIKNIPNPHRSATIGHTFMYWCMYPDGTLTNKFICKGEDPSICQRLHSTAQLNTNTGKFSMQDDKEKSNITITVRDITTNDAGTYWCGAESTDSRRSNPFFNKLTLTVVPLVPVSAPNKVAIIAVPIVAVLLLVLILVLVYKRCSKHKSNEEILNNEEDFRYEEIEEHPNKPGSGTAMKTIYVTANHPTIPSDSSHYSYITHPNNSGEVSGDTYSTVKDNGQCPTYSTVNHPTGLSETPLYSTVNRPQEN